MIMRCQSLLEGLKNRKRWLSEGSSSIIEELSKVDPEATCCVYFKNNWNYMRASILCKRVKYSIKGLDTLYNNPNVYKSKINSLVPAHTYYPFYIYNDFFSQSSIAVGGGTESLMHSAEKSIRINGGIFSIGASLLLYMDKPFYSYTMQSSNIIETINHHLFGKHKLKINSNYFYKLNTDSSPGVYYQHIMRSLYKGSVYVFFSHLYIREQIKWLFEYDPMNIPNLLFTIKLRGKLLKYDEVEEKLSNNKPTSRVISVTDIYDHIMSYPIYHPIMELVRKKLIDCSFKVAIGIQRLSHDWCLLGERLCKFDYCLCLDWSSFDTSIPELLIYDAWRVIEESFDLTDTSTYNYISHLRSYVCTNISHKLYHHDQHIFNCNRGIPSGSLWTSILGSIINYIIIYTFMIHHNRLGMSSYDIIVYGDDSIIGINIDNIKKRKYFEKNIISDFADFALRKFGMRISKEKSKLCKKENFQVGIKIPVYDLNSYSEMALLSGTRDKLAHHYIEQKEYGYKPDYSKGITHRWQYSFSNSPSFLQLYFGPKFYGLSPALHTWERLLNPEKPIKNVCDYENILFQHISDNPHNLHVLNQGSHLYIDLMDSYHLYKGSKIKEEFNLRWKNGPYYQKMYGKNRDLTIERALYRRTTGYWDLNTNVRYALYMKMYKHKLTTMLGHVLPADMCTMSETSINSEWEIHKNALIRDRESIVFEKNNKNPVEHFINSFDFIKKYNKKKFYELQNTFDYLTNLSFYSSILRGGTYSFSDLTRDENMLKNYFNKKLSIVMREITLYVPNIYVYNFWKLSSKNSRNYKGLYSDMGNFRLCKYDIRLLNQHFYNSNKSDIYNQRYYTIFVNKFIKLLEEFPECAYLFIELLEDLTGKCLYATKLMNKCSIYYGYTLIKILYSILNKVTTSNTSTDCLALSLASFNCIEICVSVMYTEIYFLSHRTIYYDYLERIGHFTYKICNEKKNYLFKRKEERRPLKIWDIKWRRKMKTTY